MKKAAYDSWGNLTNKGQLQGHSTGESWTNASDGTNHMIGWGYDGGGNLTSVNGITLNTFNAENQWTHQSSFNISYLYDGDGRRVQSSGGASGTRIYWYDESGQVIMESKQDGSVLNEYLYVGGLRVARVANGASPYYYYGDHLGTPRLITDGGGTTCYDADYFLWGGEQQVYTNSCPQNYKFTGKERDPDMGVDYFGARFYSHTMARFYSPDWSETPTGVPYADFTDPQTLNLYSYVRNNPLALNDATGHYHCDPDTATWGPNGVTVTAGACHLDWSDFPFVIGAAGHHFIPRQVWADINKASDAWKFLNKVTTRALKNPRLSNSFDARKTMRSIFGERQVFAPRPRPPCAP